MIYSISADRVVFDSSSVDQIPPPKEWIDFYTLASPPGFRDKATIFLHEMKTPKGDSRLVAVDIAAGPTALVLETRTFKPGTLFEREHAVGDVDSDALPGAGEKSFKVYAGVADPADPTHFSFRATQGKDERIYDGWLSSSGDLRIVERSKSLWFGRSLR